MTKVCGIVCDNYKIDMYKKKLAENNFLDFTVHPFNKECSTIKVTVNVNDVKQIGRICQLVEMHFKRAN